MMDRLTGDFKGASMFATVEQAMQYNRLAQYENTGLTPDEIAALKAENDLLKRTILNMKEQYENPPTRTCTTYRAALTQHDSAQDGREGAEHD